MEMDDLDDEEFAFSRNYFLAKELGGSKKKSSGKLADIDVVDEQELRAAAANIEPKHEREIAALISSYKSSYSKWVSELRCGFGLLMYGFGSKKSLIEDFASTALMDYSVIVVNGYLQSVNIKQVIVAIAEELSDQLKSRPKNASGSNVHQTFSSRSMDDLFVFLNGSNEEDKDCFVCVVIHNIDGPGLRDSETQEYLARVAACSHVRIIASVDHVNAPLLWDKKMVHTQFNWLWYHVPTFAPYKIEGMFFPLILAHGGTAQSAKTATIVLQSLTPNAQSVFKVLIEHQLSHPDEEGMPIDKLYAICRERFLVSSQITLNSHLTEFKDHELVKTRRHSDGQDCLYIPLPSEALEKLLTDEEEEEEETMGISNLSYEECRQKRVEENKKRMEALNLPLLSQALLDSSPSKSSPSKQVKPRVMQKQLLVVRRSSRVAKQPTPVYAEVLVDRMAIPRRISRARDFSAQFYASDETRKKAFERALELQSGLEPNYPSCIKSMVRSHVSGCFWLGLPSHFCKTHLPKNDGVMTLIDEDGDEYPIIYLARKTGFSGGWKGFSIAHKLADGDAVVFQHIKPTACKVYIFRANGSKEDSDSNNS